MKKKLFNYQNLKKSKEVTLFIIDIFMLALVAINILWIIFDTLFISEVFQSFLLKVFPDFTSMYREKVHSNFPTYDMMFVAVFLTEFVIQWAVAIYRKTYHKWFFYPFIHWYDLLGCIPVGSMRWLRILRVFSILYRLNKYNIIDFSQTYPARVAKKYLDIIVEEVSDRVVINVLNGVQKEIKTGNPVVERISKEVLAPQKEVISHWVSQRINDLNMSVYNPRREDFRAYVDKTISEALKDAPKLKLLDSLPIVGPTLAEILDDTVSVVVFSVTDRLFADLGNAKNDALVAELTEQIMQQFSLPSHSMNEASSKILLEVIEIVKEEVSVQQWKLEEKIGIESAT